MAWGQDDFWKGFQSKRGANALIGLGTGLLSGNTFAKGLAAGGQGFMQGAQLDEQYAAEEQAQAEEAETKNKTMEWLRSQGYDDLVAGVEGGGLDVSTAWGEALRRGQPVAPDYTAEQRNFMFAQDNPEFAQFLGSGDGGMTDTQTNLSWRAREAGLQPGTPEYQQFMASGGSGGTNLTVDPSTGAVTFSQGGGSNRVIDAGLGTEYVKIQQEALNAVQGLQTLEAMEQQMGDPSFYSGFGADQLMTLKSAAASMGIDPDSVTSMETFRSLSNKAVLDQMGGSLGTGVSNADRSFIEQQVAQLGNTVEGNRAIIGVQRKLAERKIQMADLADRYRAANGSMNGFATYLAQWAEANPLFARGGAAGGQQNAPIATNPQTGQKVRWDGSQWVPFT